MEYILLIENGKGEKLFESYWSKKEVMEAYECQKENKENEYLEIVTCDKITHWANPDSNS